MIRSRAEASALSDEDEEMEASALSDEGEEIIENVLNEFKLLAEIPRPSHHEQKISDFLVGWAQERGFSPVQDGKDFDSQDLEAAGGHPDKARRINTQ